MAAVIGVPDPIRTEIVKVRLAAHEYPREVAFVAELPMTVTGKGMRRVLRSQAAEATRQKPI
jgi:acetyl-CoA synthetase